MPLHPPVSRRAHVALWTASLCLVVACAGGGAETPDAAADATTADTATSTDTTDDDAADIHYQIPGTDQPQITIRGRFETANRQPAEVDIDVQGGTVKNGYLAGFGERITVVEPGSAVVTFTVHAPGHITRKLEVRGERDLGVVPLVEADLDLGESPQVAQVQTETLLVATAGRAETHEPYGVRRLDTMARGTWVVTATDDPKAPHQTHLDDVPLLPVARTVDDRHALLRSVAVDAAVPVAELAWLDVASRQVVARGPWSDTGLVAGPETMGRVQLQPGPRRVAFELDVATTPGGQPQPGTAVVEVGNGKLTLVRQLPGHHEPRLSVDGHWLTTKALPEDPQGPLTLWVHDLVHGTSQAWGPVGQLGIGGSTQQTGNSAGQWLADGTWLNIDAESGCADCALVRANPGKGQAPMTVLPDGVAGVWSVANGQLLVHGVGTAARPALFLAGPDGTPAQALSIGTLWSSSATNGHDLFITAAGQAVVVSLTDGTLTPVAQGVPDSYWVAAHADAVTLDGPTCSPCPVDVWDPGTRTLASKGRHARRDGLLGFGQIPLKGAPAAAGVMEDGSATVRPLFTEKANLTGIAINWQSFADAPTSAAFLAPCLGFVVGWQSAALPTSEGYCTAH